MTIKQEITLPEGTEDFPAVSAVIPLFNRPEDIRRLLTSFGMLDYPGQLGIIIVDDASTQDHSAAFEDFRRRCPQIALSVIRNSSNAGPSRSRNAGLETIQADYVWFLDSDTEIFQKDMLRNAVRILRDDPLIAGVGEEAFVLGGRSITRSSRWYPNLFYQDSFCDYEASPSRYNLVLSTANLILRRAVLEQTGAFNPLLRMFEDADLCFRLKDRGYKLYSCKEVAVYHHCSSKGREGNFSFYDDLGQYTRMFHRERVKLVALNRKHALPLLPLLDLALGFKLFFAHWGRKYNPASFMTAKKNKRTNLVMLAFRHFVGMLRSYAYAYRIIFTGRI